LSLNIRWEQKTFFLFILFFIKVAALSYSFYYIKSSKDVSRFYLILGLFITSMVVLLFSKTLVLVFCG